MLPVGGNPPLHNFCPFIFCWFADSQRTFYHDRPYDLVAFAGCYHREIPTILEIPFSALVYCQSCVAVRTFLMLALRVRLPLMTAFGAGYNLLGGFMPDMIDKSQIMKVVLGFLFSLSAYFGSATYEVPFVGIAQPPSFLLPPFPRLSVPPHGSPPLGIAGACRPLSCCKQLVLRCTAVQIGLDCPLEMVCSVHIVIF